MLSQVSSSHNLACYSPSFERSECVTVYFLAHQTSTLRSLSVAPYAGDIRLDFLSTTLQLLAKHQQQSRQSSKQASRTALPIEQQASDTSTDNIKEPQEPTRTQEIPKDVKDRTWTTLTFQESQREAMAMQTLSSRTLSDSERLAQQLAQTTLATTTSLSGVRGRGTTQPVPQGGGSGGNPRGNPGGGNPGGGGGGNPPPGGGQPAGQQAAPTAHGERLMGAPPVHFEGDRTRAEEFIDKVTDHFLLNHQHIPFQSAITRVAYTLSHVKGPQTAT
jgi:hypothetical protein